MSRITLEWSAGPQKWRQISVNLCFSHKGNYYIKHGNDAYVFKDLRQGAKVFSKVDGKWQTVGRISFGSVFIGSPEQQSYEEWSRSPEGLKESARMLEEIRASFQRGESDHE